MNAAIAAMLDRYECRSASDYGNALREIFQEISLCGLWRAKFHEKAAFYGGTALRILYGLDRFSEDMDFSLLAPDASFDLKPYCRSIEDELSAFGFRAVVEPKVKTTRTAIESAFLKANTRQQLLVIDAGEDVAAATHGERVLKIRIEVDTDPPAGFATETKFLLQPIPFSVRAFAPPSLFAGKMHAILCRPWRSRTKGRDWYDLVWYVGRGIALDLAHLEARMGQSGHYTAGVPLDEQTFRSILAQRIAEVDFADAASEVERFVRDHSAVRVWSPDFFTAVADRIKVQATVDE